MFNVGDTVGHSDYALRSARDHWQRQGEATRKARAKAAFDAEAAARGQVTELKSNGVAVLWNDGRVSTGLSYMYEARP